MVMLRRQGKDVDLFKNRKYIDYIRGFHDENYENYFIGLENGHKVTATDFRFISTEKSYYCIKLAELNSTAEKLVTVYANDAETFWPNCMSMSHRGGKLMVYKRSVCMCADPATKLIVTCSCNDHSMPKISFPMWTKTGVDPIDIRVPGHQDLQYVGFSENVVGGLEFKAGPVPWKSESLFKYYYHNHDICYWANETVTTPYHRQHCCLYCLFEGKGLDYQIVMYSRAGWKYSIQRPFRTPFVASDKPRGTDIDGGYWTKTPFPPGSAHDTDKTCLLCPDP